MEICLPKRTTIKEVITAKYGMKDKWMREMVTSPYNSIWRSIRNLRHLVISKSSCKVGNSEKVAFWNDIWCGKMSLKHAFPEQYPLRKFQEATMATVAKLWTGKG